MYGCTKKLISKKYIQNKNKLKPEGPWRRANQGSGCKKIRKREENANKEKKIVSN